MIILTEFQAYGICNKEGHLWDGNFQWVDNVEEAWKTKSETELDEMSQSLTYRGLEHIQVLITNYVEKVPDGWLVKTRLQEIQ